MKLVKIIGLALLCAMLAFACASTGGDLKITEGVLRHDFSNLVITEGKEYEVILSVNDFDKAMYGCRLGGKLYYGNSNLLAGRVEAVPAIITGPGDYVLTFKAGDQHQTAAENCAKPATTPSGSTQYFQFEVQTGGWRPVTDNYRIAGTITVREKSQPAGTLTKTADIVTTGGDYADTSTGMGSIVGDFFDALKAAPAGSVLRFYITCPMVYPISSNNGPRPGWAIGSVGSKNQLNPGDINPNMIFYIPATAPLGANSAFTVDFPVSDCLVYRNSPSDSWLFVSLWHDCKVTKCELWEYR
jgi:hypothetical protein